MKSVELIELDENNKFTYNDNKYYITSKEGFLIKCYNMTCNKTEFLPRYLKVVNITNSIIEEMNKILSFLSGKQREFYEDMMADAKEINIVPLKEVFSSSEIELIKKVVNPKKNECYKNASLLTKMFPDKVKYCEGKTTVKNIVSIEHAWNKVGDKYVDITTELVLGRDIENHKEDYVAFGEWNSDELLDFEKDMLCYGGLYEFFKLKKYKDNKN